MVVGREWCKLVYNYLKKTTNMLPSEYQKKYKERLDGE